MDLPELGHPKESARHDDRITHREVELIRYRDNRTTLVVKLLSGEELEGAIRWYDSQALRLIRPDRTEMTVYLQAVAYYHAKV